MKNHRNSEFLKGVVLSLVGGGATMTALAVLPGEAWARTVALLILPLAIYGVFVRQALPVLAMLYTSELFFGVGGGWISFGWVSGRSLMLASTLCLYFLFSSPDNRGNGADKRRGNWVLFYAILFPLILLSLSLGQGNQVGNAISDVMRFGGLLAYFPLREAILRRGSLLMGWIIGASAVVSVAFSLLASGSESIRMALLSNWILGCSTGSDFSIESFLMMERGFFPPLVLCFIAFFSGMLTFSAPLSKTARAACAGCAAAAAAAFILNFARGPILSAAVIIGLILLIAALSGRAMIVLAIVSASATIGVIGYFITVNYLPTAMSKWKMDETDLLSLVSDVRVEQVKAMIEHWKTSPLIGTGVGSIIPGYARDDSGLAFEVQYPMVLYRIGIIGTLILMTPFAIRCIKSIKYTAKARFRFASVEGAFYSAIGFALMAHLCAGWMNPYFATAMTPFLLALILACEGIVAPKQPAFTHHGKA